MIPWYKQKTTWTAVAAVVTALGAYISGEIGLTALITAAFSALGLVFMRQGVSKSGIPSMENRGETPEEVVDSL